jgi:hypothetical protein
MSVFSEATCEQRTTWLVTWRMPLSTLVACGLARNGVLQKAQPALPDTTAAETGGSLARRARLPVRVRISARVPREGLQIFRPRSLLGRRHEVRLFYLSPLCSLIEGRSRSTVRPSGVSVPAANCPAITPKFIKWRCLMTMPFQDAQMRCRYKHRLCTAGPYRIDSCVLKSAHAAT